MLSSQFLVFSGLNAKQFWINKEDNIKSNSTLKLSDPKQQNALSKDTSFYHQDKYKKSLILNPEWDSKISRDWKNEGWIKDPGFDFSKQKFNAYKFVISLINCHLTII